MRRLFAVLLLALLLTACATPQPAAPSSAPTDAPAQSGVTVKTDYSAYTPHTALEPLYTRLSEDFISDLQPSEDYGRLYPFAGSTLTHATEDGHGYQAGSLYGMVDSKGRIVADPVYHDISLLQDKDGDPMPYWLLGRASGQEGEYLYAIASLDGSFVTDCIYNSYIYGSDSHITAIQETDDSCRFDVYTLEGELVLRSEDLLFRERIKAILCPSGFSEGLFTIGLAPDNPNANYSEYYYINIAGELVLGPYQSYHLYHAPTSFSEGMAVVRIMTGEFAYIDHDGNILLKGYSDASNFKDGTAIVSDSASDSWQVIDAAGNVLIDGSDNYYIQREDTGFIVHSDAGLTYYDKDCNLLYGGPVGNQYRRLTESGIFYDIYADDCTLLDANTGHQQVLEVEHYNYAYSLESLDYFSCYCLDKENQTFSFVLMDDTLTERLSGPGFINALTDAFSDDVLLWQNAPGSVTVYDAALTPLFKIPTSSFDSLQRYGDRICCTDAFACSYYDLEGNLLFRYPPTNSMED